MEYSVGYEDLSVAMLQMDKMVETALPEDLESMEMGQLYNIELPGRIEQEKGWNELEQWKMWKLVL